VPDVGKQTNLTQAYARAITVGTHRYLTSL
jgi:hypothetical protein